MESLAAMKSTGPYYRRIGDEVYVSAVALRATKGPAQLIMSSAYSLNLWDLQHFMVLVKPYSSNPDPHLSQVLVFDFQPEDPENIFVGLSALSGGSIKGSVFRRKLRRLPNRKCWFVGHSIVDTTEDVINNFNKNWETELKIGHHDCRHYTNELVKCLTGEENVLDRLRTEPLQQDS
ncbi:uncharacterized protein LOC124919961 [Impatiens glandulifera]|uniref:uncharacterized protein LOC124919961 n=1 Tax=Impatiens glandulifera TaxID=253017 RepID=UPI001FB0D73E|nr:uncharacterized protein LOC124919961 [Impatiens glandulifera]